MSAPDRVAKAAEHYHAGRLGAATEILELALSESPDNDAALSYMGRIADRQGRLLDAAGFFRKALDACPANPQHHFSLATMLLRLERRDEALAAFLESLRLDPDFAPSHNNLATLYIAQGNVQEAEKHCRAAITLNPGYAGAHCNLGKLLSDQGRQEEAMAAYRKALEIEPGFVAAHSNLLMALNYSGQHSAQEIFEEHRRWAKQFAEPLLPPAPRFANDRSPNRRLRIGYVSADLRTHSVSFFMESILGSHNRAAFDIHCFSDVRPELEDQTTARLKRNGVVWHRTAVLDDGKLADLIRGQGIDILVDLAGHTSGNRLLAFARRPAPVQLTYLGYPNTTGLGAIDYRITDETADPPGQEQFYSEKLLRLDCGFLCYTPGPGVPDIGPLPASRNGFVTFGSFNSLAKVTEGVIQVWARVLKATPGSRLLLKAKQAADSSVRSRLCRLFLEAGVNPERLVLHGPLASSSDHLTAYNSIDLALDTFPYNGTTTTIEALLMGVPVITVEGACHAGRVGTDILRRLGLSTFVTSSPEKYVALSQYLASSPERLERLRAGLRNALLSSHLCNAASFTRELESAYREIWQRWTKRKES